MFVHVPVLPLLPITGRVLALPLAPQWHLCVWSRVYMKLPALPLAVPEGVLGKMGMIGCDTPSLYGAGGCPERLKCVPE